MAMRDVVLVPSANGNSTAVVVDRARTGAASRALHLRFRTKVGLALGPEGAQGAVGSSSLKIVPLFKSSGTASVRQTAKGDCFGKDSTRGGCAAARFPVQDYVLTVSGEDALAVHVLDMAGANEKLPAARISSEPDHRIVSFERGSRRAAVVIAAPGDRPKLTYRAAPGHHVVLDAPGSRTGRSSVVATRDGALCVVTVTPAASGGVDARPLAIVVSDTCTVKEDATQFRPVLASLDGAGSPSQPPGPGPASPDGNVDAGAGAVAATGSGLPATFFTPPPDANQLPAPVPKIAGSHGGFGCAAVGGTGTSGSCALLTVGVAALLAARRRRSR